MKGTIVWGIAAAVLVVTGIVCLRIATVIAAKATIMTTANPIAR